MPNFSGSWKIIRSENFEDLLKVLAGRYTQCCVRRVLHTSPVLWGLHFMLEEPEAQKGSVTCPESPGLPERPSHVDVRAEWISLQNLWLPQAIWVNVMLRKIAVAAASKPAVEIKQEGDTFYIKTSTTVRTTEINFKIGEEFEEQTVDGRPCKSLVKWESENKMVCEQRLLKGEGPKTSWTRELTNDGELVLTMTADDIVCTRVYVRE
ncbi:cellular retinoic acid-binding protein 2 isoform X1 [Acinonyx jubatus]|uniref:Cellular retinoic acid-binding protein 2 isoform X1 n=2 Tax=Felidae TaxID=9681 RepID=A0ABM3P0L6_ACIJB|nr:cellular retinoic acid-binding protein 2 isoform X1 [Acinonyx jubatus]